MHLEGGDRPGPPLRSVILALQQRLGASSMMDVPAHKLEGLTLASGWKVVKKYIRTDGLSAGRYSVGYYVERAEERGFLKAIDYSRATKEADMPAAMLNLVRSFEFERNVLRECSTRHMDRVISPKEDGEVTVDSSLLGRVNYIIFDIADGDIRDTLARIDRFELTQRLRALQHIATGLCQLHDAGIAHQDVKPSNVLAFKAITKVADLGSVSVKSTPGPTDARACAGTKAYAPPEILYQQIDPDFGVRRFGCDCYLMGSMVFFVFTGLVMTADILSHLAPEHSPKGWGGTYKDVLPYVQDAFCRSVADFSGEIANDQLRADLKTVIKELCEPDPQLRGHPLNRQARHGNQYGLERYRTKFDLLARRAAIGLFA